MAFDPISKHLQGLIVEDNVDPVKFFQEVVLPKVRAWRHERDKKRLADAKAEEEKLQALIADQNKILANLKNPSRLSRKHGQKKDAENLKKKLEDQLAKLANVQSIHQIYSLVQQNSSNSSIGTNNNISNGTNNNSNSTITTNGNNSSDKNTTSNNNKSNNKKFEFIEANDQHELSCKVCLRAFEYPSDLRKHLKKECIKKICKNDPPHEQCKIIKAFKTLQEAELYRKSLCHPNDDYKDGRAKNSTVCKQNITQKCSYSFATTESKRYLPDGSLLDVYVVFGCSIHSHGEDAPKKGFCKLQHPHIFVDLISCDVDEGEKIAEEKFDKDCNRMSKKLDNYTKYTCGAEGCSCEIIVNYTNRDRVTIRGCISHQGHIPRNIDSEARCYIDHLHQRYKKSFDKREDALSFLKQNQLDTEFIKGKKYETPTKFHQVYLCSRRGTYQAKIDTKKNIGKLRF